MRTQVTQILRRMPRKPQQMMGGDRELVEVYAKLNSVDVVNNLDDFEAYDNLLEQPLLHLGWKIHMISWRDESVNWNDYAAVIIRSPWDYQDDAPAFLDVLNNIEQSSAHLENSLTTVEWNIDKKYLRELECDGVNIVKTLWREKLTLQHVGEYFDETPHVDE